MNLEDRVQILEKEVQLLKGEIQALLLDMQEYLLNQTHPELRTVNSEQPAPNRRETTRDTQELQRVQVPAEADNAPYPQQAHDVPPVHPTPDIRDTQRIDRDDRIHQGIPHQTARESSNHVPSVTPPQPEVQKRTTTTRQREHKHPPSRDADAPNGWASDITETQQWLPTHKLESWALRKLNKYGAQRTRKLVEHHASEGNLDEEQVGLLMQFIDLYELKHRSAPSIPPTPPSASDHQTVSVPAPQAPEDVEIEFQDENKSNLILRLIAGVQNAGIGITRRNPDG